LAFGVDGSYGEALSAFRSTRFGTTIRADADEHARLAGCVCGESALFAGRPESSDAGYRPWHPVGIAGAAADHR
jgi:hypothetical protein